MHSLPIFLKLKDRPVILVGVGEAAQAKRVLLERAGARIVREAEPAAIAVIAVEDEDEALAASARLKARGILVNVTDRPDHCDFTLPAIVDRDPVLVAIGTGGASAGLAKALRQRLEPLLPQSLGALAEALRGARAQIRQRWPDPAARRTAIDRALDTGGPLDPLLNVESTAMADWMSNPDESSASGLKVIHLSCGDPDQLTLEQARWLSRADRIIHSPDVSPAIVARGRADATRLCSVSVPEPLLDGLTVQLVRDPK